MRKPKGKISPNCFKKRMHIHSRSGMHARPAALFVQVANRFKSTIRVCKGRNEVDGKSIMGVLTLAAGRGSTVELIVKGPDAREAIRTLEQLLSHQDMPAVVTVVRHPSTAFIKSGRHSHGSSSGS